MFRCSVINVLFVAALRDSFNRISNRVWNVKHFFYFFKARCSLLRCRRYTSKVIVLMQALFSYFLIFLKYLKNTSKYWCNSCRPSVRNPSSRRFFSFIMNLIRSSETADDKKNYDHEVREAVLMIDLIGSSEAADDKKACKAGRIMIMRFAKRFSW